MIIKYDNKAIKYTNKWISVDSGPTPPGPTPVEYVQIGNLLWQTSNMSIDDGGEGIYSEYDPLYGTQYYYSPAAMARISQTLTDDWRIAGTTELEALFTAVGGGTNINKLCAESPYWTGTNETGFNLMPVGYLRYTDQVDRYEWGADKVVAFIGSSDGYWYYLIGSEGGFWLQSWNNNYFYPVRLCKDAT